VSARVLVVEDDVVARDLLVEVLEREGYEIHAAESAEEALQVAAAVPPDVLVTDLRLDGMDGIELMQRLRARSPGLQTIVVTAFGSLETAVEAIHAGAFDYMSKPFAMKEVQRMVRRAVQAGGWTASSAGSPPTARRRLVGSSPEMTRVYKSIAHVAPLKVAVLVQGETGTGKELVSRAIHEAGPRRDAPYLALNCPSIPEGLLESELFGHVRGAFTGASGDRPGLFEAAHGGTLLLDEIADLSLPVQAKLLRVLESGELRRVGSSDVMRVDVRVVAATNVDLAEAVARRAFREDLLYRLNAVTIRVPPLRERPSDIPQLIDYFLEEFGREADRAGLRASPAATTALTAYPWPGNVRELAHVLERAVALSKAGVIDADDLPSVVRHARPDMVSRARSSSAQTLEAVERAHILATLESVGGARSQTAAILGIDRKTLYRKLRQYGIEDEPGSEA
jgi:two-component system response regulator AtoC